MQHSRKLQVAILSLFGICLIKGSFAWGYNDVYYEKAFYSAFECLPAVQSYEWTLGQSTLENPENYVRYYQCPIIATQYYKYDYYGEHVTFLLNGEAADGAYVRVYDGNNQAGSHVSATLCCRDFDGATVYCGTVDYSSTTSTFTGSDTLSALPNASCNILEDIFWLYISLPDIEGGYKSSIDGYEFYESRTVASE